MERTRNQDEELRGYLLGQCSAEEQKRVEERLLSDSDYFNGLERVEESLTDEYVHGLIQGVEKERFENHFLKSPRHQNDLQFARLLYRYFSTQETTGETAAPLPFPSRWRFVLELSLACIAIVLVGISVFLLREVTNLRGQSQRLQAQRAGAEQREQALAGQIQDQQRQMKDLIQKLTDLQGRSSTNDANMISLSLTPGTERSAEGSRSLTIPPHVQWLQLKLNFRDGNYPNYQVQVQTVEGRQVWVHDGLQASVGNHNKVLDIVVPASLISPSDYLVILSGKTRSGIIDEVATYYLNVVRK